MNQKIITTNLTKVYTTFEKEEGLRGSIKSLFNKTTILKKAISEFDLEIREGEFVGLIGPNGAGKTTLIKMLTGIIHPTSGSVSVFGYTPYELKDEYKKKFSVVMGQKSQLWWDLPAVDSFLLNKELYGIKDNEYRKTLSYLVELLGIEKLLNIQVRNLSLGERMKMELVSALLHKPSILFLDEPTIGLDGIAQKQIRKFLKQINEENGVTIILTSHYMEDIKYLCNRTVVVRGGSKIYDGSLDSILEKYQTFRTVSVTFEKAMDKKLQLDVEWIEQSDFKWVFRVKKEEAKGVIKSILDNFEVDDIGIEDESLGDVVDKIYSAKELIIDEKIY
jgi:ABC-2 type transport system ATP-binding protein